MILSVMCGLGSLLDKNNLKKKFRIKWSSDLNSKNTGQGRLTQGEHIFIIEFKRIKPLISLDGDLF